MSGFVARFAAVVCLLVFLSGQSSANFWQQPVVNQLPSDPNDAYYRAFQHVPSIRVTATTLMTNFLHIDPMPHYSLHHRITRAQRRQRRELTQPEDVVVVLDGSGSVDTCEFNKGKEALKNMMELANGSPQYDTKYAAVTFDTSAIVNFKFLPFSTAASEIMKIPYPGGWTNTQAGLEEAKKLFFNSGRFFGSLKKVLLVTDGQSNLEQHLTIPKAEALKSIGVEIHVVAVGRYISGIDELVKVSTIGYKPNSRSREKEPFLYRVEKNYDILKVIELIIEEVDRGKYNIKNYSPPC